MGCSQSKIEHEEAVTRCKERKRFMKDAVSARNAFAAAHSAYTVVIKNTGAALSDYGHGQNLDLQSSTTAAAPLPPSDDLPPPPPPIFNFPPAPLQRAASMPEFVLPKHDPIQSETIQEEDEEDDETVNKPQVEEEEPPPLPPSPPPRTQQRQTTTIPPPPPPAAAKETSFDYIFNVQDIPGPSLSSETTHQDNIPQYKPPPHDDQHQQAPPPLKRTDNIGSHIASTSKILVEEPIPEKVIEPEEVKPLVRKPKAPVNTATDAKRGVKVASNVTLVKMLDELDDMFLQASEGAHQVSKLLEANRMHYHSNFADNRGHIDHSARLMRVITWNRSIKGLQTTEDTYEDDDRNETLATVLDKLLAWEKKLYDEVKASELMKIEYQKKVALLNKQSKRGTHSEALEKAKAAVGHLHTRYIVDIQSMDSTVSEITQLRDDHLYRNLVLLVEAMAKMWGTMSVQHISQMKKVEHLKSLDVSQGPKETSEEHHKRTLQLWGIVEDWHSNFRKLVTHQKEYILALNNWLKLNLIPIESSLKEKVSSPPRIERPPIQSLLIAWHDHLEKLPDELARGSIASFAAIVKNIVVHQDEEEKLKMKCEETKKELTRKRQALKEWYEKHRPLPDEVEDINHKDPLGEKQFIIESLEKRLEVEVEAYQQHCRQVRERSLGSLKSHLPELFRSMSEFSVASSDMYKRLLSITQSQKRSESLS